MTNVYRSFRRMGRRFPHTVLLSYLYKDNVFYKLAEHIFVGVSAAHWATSLSGTRFSRTSSAAMAAGRSRRAGRIQQILVRIYHVLHVLFKKVFPEDVINAHALPRYRRPAAESLIPDRFCPGLFMLSALSPRSAGSAAGLWLT